jgi:hypothetical protein
MQTGDEPMFFAWFGRTVASLMLLFATLRILIAVSIASDWVGPREEAIKRYLGSVKTTGEAIDKAVYVIFLAIALGVLAEIFFAIRKKT